MVDLDGMPAGAGLLAALLDPTLTLDGESELVDLLAVIAGFERVKSLVEACQNEALAAYAALGPDQTGGGRVDTAQRWHDEQLGLVLGVSGPSAAHRMTQAVVLTESMPALSAALRAGHIGTGHARAAARLAGPLPVEVARAADAAVMAAGPGGVDPDRPQWRTPAQYEHALTAAVITADPDGAADRHTRRRRERCVRFRNEPDGMASVWSLHPAEDAQLMAKTLDTIARGEHAHPEPGDHRTLDHRRADTLRDLICGTTAPHGSSPGPDNAGPGPGTRRGGPRIAVTVAWSTLIGADNTPADLTGYGPITADTARRIAADPTATWRRLLLDPASGTLLDVGTTTYRPPTTLHRHITHRDQHCRFPTCHRPADTCELDHRNPYDHTGQSAGGGRTGGATSAGGRTGGTTSVDNLDALCPRHHHLKHHPAWTHHRHPDTADSIWSTPTGTTHTKPPTRLPTPAPVEPPPPRDDGDPPF